MCPAGQPDDPDDPDHPDTGKLARIWFPDVLVKGTTGSGWDKPP